MDDVLFEEVDVNDEQAAWARVVDNLKTLDSYYDEISRMGCISRDHARTLVQECGVAMGERYPLQSFTDVASRTNLSVAMESMVDRTAKLVMELLQKAAELLLKIVDWVVDLIKTRRDRSRQTAQKTESIRVVGGANKELSEAGIDAVQVDTATDKAVAAAQQTVENAREIYENNFNDLVADIITSGDFSRTVREVSNTVFDFAPLLRDKLMLFDKILRTPVRPGDNTANMVEVSELRTIATPIPVNAVTMLMRRGGLDVMATKGSQPQLLEAMRVLFDAYQQHRMGREYDPVSIQIVADYLTATHSNVIAPFMLAPDETSRTMQEIRRELQRIRGLQPSHMAPPENREAFQKAVAVLTDEVNAMQLFISVVEGCSLTQDRLVDDICRYEVAQFQLNRAKAGASNNSSLIQEVNRIQDTLRTALNRFAKW